MTDQPDGYLVVQKHGQTVTYPVTFNPDPPPPDPDLEARKATAAMVIPASIHALDRLDDPVSRAVLDLHRRHTSWEKSSRWECAECPGDEYPTDWPCATVEAVAAAHGIDLTDDWLFDRPTDGSLDQEAPRP